MDLVRTNDKYDALAFWGKQVDELTALYMRSRILDENDPTGLTQEAQGRAINYETAMDSIKRLGGDVAAKYPGRLPVQSPQDLKKIVQNWVLDKHKNWEDAIK
ncbi:MAG TPA: hypothetical protein VJZ93_01320 [Candidatus Nanoarchaeia archaeon]|nr:hypothetical protein [Candidatus Nanoarchaeia archaeon]